MSVIGSILLCLVVAFGAFIMRNWAPDVPVAALLARWASSPSQFERIDGMDVHLRDEGIREDREPIILIHGTAANLHTWQGWADALSHSRRVVRMDLPAFGLTGPAGNDDYSPLRYAAFIVAFMDKLGIARATLVGNSFGGGIAWLTAALTPERVGHLIIIDAAGYPLNSTRVPLGLRLAATPGLRRFAANLLSRRLIAASLREVYGDPAKLSENTIDLYYDMMRREGNRAALVSQRAQADFTPHRALIAGIAQPTLIFWGERDRLVNPRNADRFHHEIMGSQLIVFPGLGHVPQEEDPAATMTAAMNFLSATCTSGDHDIGIGIEIEPRTD